MEIKRESWKQIPEKNNREAHVDGERGIERQKESGHNKSTKRL